MANKEILQALGVVCELTGTKLSEAATRVFADDLSLYPEEQVLGALARCRKEIRGRLTLTDVISRLDDGRPGPEEAWAIISSALADERITVVWTDEMALASGPARAIIEDRVAARMAFLESYRRLVQLARDDGEPVKWSQSLGYDVHARAGPLLEAVRLGRLPESHVAKLLPYRGEPAANVADKLPNLAKRLQ